MWSMLLTALLAAAPAQAQEADCDARALERKAKEASPVAVADAYAKLVACAPERAAKVADTVVPRIVADRDAIPALVGAIEVGAGKTVRTWLDAQEPDKRSRTIASIGEACSDKPVIGDFFVAAHADLGATFFEERWHRGLGDCRTEPVQTLLTEALSGDAVGRDSRNRNGFLSVLEVYARNLGAGAIERLSDYLSKARDDEEATYLVSLFADAANVGGTDGLDTAAAKAAVDAIQSAAPDLPSRALDRARGTLTSLGATKEASALARHAFADRFTDGAYLYGVVAIEDITCKNGSKRAVLHWGGVKESGRAWPDELREGIDEAVKGAWTLDHADKCRGTSEITIRMSPEPLVPDGGLDGWRDKAVETFEERFGGVKKTWIVAEDGFGI